MTELMKRYEAETGKDRPTVNIYSLIDWYEAFSAWLADQLSWRPVSEKPEKADMYFVECKPYTGCGSTIVTTAWFDGEKFLWHDVVKWLPIPPAPEGEKAT
jgi:hypothetical protein